MRVSLWPPKFEGEEDETIMIAGIVVLGIVLLFGVGPCIMENEAQIHERKMQQERLEHEAEIEAIKARHER